MPDKQQLPPSQQNRSPIMVNATLKDEFRQWCDGNNITMKDAVEAFMRMCLVGKWNILTEIKLTKAEQEQPK